MARVRTSDSRTYDSSKVNYTLYWHNENHSVNPPQITDFTTTGSTRTKGYVGQYRTISDIFTNPYGVNICSHSKQICNRYSFQSQTMSIAKAQSTPGGVWMVKFDAFEGGEWPPNDITWPSPNWASIVSNVSSTLDGQLSSKMLILAEMYQLKQTIQMIKNPFGCLSKGWKRKAGKLSAHSLSKWGSNIWLEYRYGWSQLYRDIKEILRTKRRIDNHIEYLRQIAGKYASHGSSAVQMSTYSLPSDPGFTMPVSIVSTTAVTEAKQTISFSLDYLANDLDRIWSKAQLWQQALGTGDLLATVWEVIPFSFIVDWFIDFNGIGTDNPIFWNTSRCKDLCYSIKRELKAVSKTRFFSAGWNQNMSMILTSEPKVVRSYYQRYLGFPPNTTNVGLFGGCNLTHLLDGAALIMQRL